MKLTNDENATPTETASACFGTAAPPNRRQLLRATAAVTLATPFVLRNWGAYADNFAGKSIRLLTWSDVGGQMILENVAKPLQTTTGAKVVPDLTGSSSEMVAKI